MVVSWQVGSIQRTRPYAYNPNYPTRGYSNLPFDDKIGNREANKSFFSADVSLAFAFGTMTVTMFSHYYPSSTMIYVIGAGTAAYVSFVSYLRYASGWHYPSDILVGAIVGSTVGFLVPFLHLRKELKIGTAYSNETESASAYISLAY